MDSNNNLSPIAIISLNLKLEQYTGIRFSLAFISLHLKSKQQGLSLPSTNAAGLWGYIYILQICIVCLSVAQ